jgi:heme O synthase-like polyprenyltransferase
MKDARLASTADVVGVAPRRSVSPFGDYVALTKPRLNLLVVASSAAGYYLGATHHLEGLPMAIAVSGTALVAGGAAVLNQV